MLTLTNEKPTVTQLLSSNWIYEDSQIHLRMTQLYALHGLESYTKFQKVTRNQVATTGNLSTGGEGLLVLGGLLALLLLPSAINALTTPSNTSTNNSRRSN